MIIHDDADAASVVRQIVSALKEGARRVGKADRRINTDQIAEVEAAMQALQRALDLKKRVNNSGS